MNNISQQFMSYVPLLATLAVCTAALWLAHYLLIARNRGLGNERMLPRQLAMLGLTLASLIALVLSLPVSDSTRNQVLGLIGLLMSGIVAFSSSTIFANLMAGIMLRVTRPFGAGDFVSVGGYFGRVAERGLLDTEIQTEDRELVAFPNTFMINNPVSVVRSSGTIVSVKLSLGYDIHHSTIESLLLDALRECELDEPFVQILELGNFAVTYKASGMLLDTKTLLTARSNLCRSVLDTLHGAGIEIMSPTIMNQRPMGEAAHAIPSQPNLAPAETLSVAEEIVFDKAVSAEQLEKEKQQLAATIKDYEALLSDADSEEKKRIKTRIAEIRARMKALEKQVGAGEDEAPPETPAEPPAQTGEDTA